MVRPTHQSHTNVQLNAFLHFREHWKPLIEIILILILTLHSAIKHLHHSICFFFFFFVYRKIWFYSVLSESATSNGAHFICYFYSHIPIVYHSCVLSWIVSIVAVVETLILYFRLEPFVMIHFSFVRGSFWFGEWQFKATRT